VKLKAILSALVVMLAMVAPAQAVILGSNLVRFDRNTVLTAAQVTRQVASVTTTATPASGTCGVQFVFKDSSGITLTTPSTMHMYLSASSGLTHATAITSFAALTNGACTSLVTGQHAIVTTTAAGLLGLTLTGSAATRYVVFVLPSGKHLISGALTIN